MLRAHKPVEVIAEFSSSGRGNDARYSIKKFG